jgi:hypothetical protein
MNFQLKLMDNMFAQFSNQPVRGRFKVATSLSIKSLEVEENATASGSSKLRHSITCKISQPTFSNIGFEGHP